MMDAAIVATRYCQVEAASVQEHAASLRQETDLETGKAVFRFVRDTIQYDIRRKMRGAMHALEERDGMCFDKTNLFVALCRANEIPARYRELRCRLDVQDEELPADAFHLVPELYLDGAWMVQDPSFDNSVSPLVRPSQWNEKTWTTVTNQRTYVEIPMYLPFLINYIMVPFSPKIREIQAALDALER